MKFEKSNTQAILPDMFHHETMARIKSPKSFAVGPFQIYKLSLLMKTTTLPDEIKIMPSLSPTKKRFTFNFPTPELTPDGDIMVTIQNETDNELQISRGDYLCNLWHHTSPQDHMTTLIPTPG